MKAFVAFIALVGTFGCVDQVLGNELARDLLVKAPYVETNIAVGGSSYFAYFPVSGENVGSAQALASYLKASFLKDVDSVFDVHNNDIPWGMPAINVADVRISSVHCGAKFRCALVGLGHIVYLFVYDQQYSLLDAALVNATSGPSVATGAYKYMMESWIMWGNNTETNSRVRALKQNRAFCSEIIIEGEEGKVSNYQRRINRNGKIEFKLIADMNDCGKE